MVHTEGYWGRTGIWAFVAVLGLLTVVSPARADTLQVTEHQITATTGLELNPVLGNDGLSPYVVYNRTDPGAPRQIWLQRLNSDGSASGSPIHISDGLTNDSFNDASGNIVVYTAYDLVDTTQGRIRGYDTETGTRFDISSTTVVSKARVAGNYVVWEQGYSGSTAVMLFDLTTLGTGTSPTRIAGPAPATSGVEISDRFIVWEESNNNQYDIRGFDFSTLGYVTIAADPAVDERNPSTSRGWVVWQAGSDPNSSILARNIDTGELRTIVTGGVSNGLPSIDGDLITYDYMPPSQADFDIYLYRLTTQETYRVTDNPADQFLNNVFQSFVAYADTRDGNFDIYVDQLTFVPESGCEPDSSLPSTERESVDSHGVEGNGASEGYNSSYPPVISAQGCQVAFSSAADNLVSSDTNGVRDVFVRNRINHTTERVSVDSHGVEGNGDSDRPAVSADGRYVAFSSAADNLVPSDTNTALDVFVRDRQAGTTERVSVDSSGTQANGLIYNDSDAPVISADGRYVAFMSDATNLVAGDNNGARDVFVRDRINHTTERVSVDSNGVEGNGYSYYPSISADGRYVAFMSEATNLVPGDTNDILDIFVHDRQTGTTERVSVDSSGAQANGTFNLEPTISADGRYVAFDSDATNLVPVDTNGTTQDVFIHDRETGTTELVDVDTQGTQPIISGQTPSISADGRYVSFSTAGALTANDTNYVNDVYVRDRTLGTTTLISRTPLGESGNGRSYQTSISGDGRLVAFYSDATDLVDNDTNGVTDVFVGDRGKVVDSDGDGVPDTSDLCPTQDATGLDANHDGCIDTLAGLKEVLETLVDEGVIDQTMENSLLSKVQNAAQSSSKDNICTAVYGLQSFEDQIEAQRDKKISSAAADLLIAYTNNVITGLENLLPAGDSCN